MTIYFGMELDEGAYLTNPTHSKNYLIAGPKNLLSFFEKHLGFIGHENNIDYLRIEQYRQVAMSFLSDDPAAFFANSFEADPFATAAELLRRRDELAATGFDFRIDDPMPERISVLSWIEAIINNAQQPEFKLTKGLIDRVNDVINAIPNQQLPVEQIILNEPFDLLPTLYKRLFTAFAETGLVKDAAPPQAPRDNSDLATFKKSFFTKVEEKMTLKNDGSLLILKSKRANEAAAWTAKFLNQNPDFQPLTLLPEKNRGLDNALIQEGLPSLGILSASLARPSLQILKLIPAFLWEPIDPYKILEFVSLAIKPLDDGLAQVIGRLMAATPGLKSEKWNRQINGYFDELRKKSEEDKDINFKAIREEYEFWFERKRYDINETVPKTRVIAIFQKLESWAYEVFENDTKNSSLIVLSEQARRVKELLETLPEQSLSFLKLERIVRTIYEPSPIQFEAEAVNRLPNIYYPSAILDETDKFLWWNFSQQESVRFFSRWYPSERDFIEGLALELDTPKLENQRMLWQRLRPIHKTQSQLVLMLSETVDGKDVHPHPLYGELEATFDNLEAITLYLENEKTSYWEPHFKLPQYIDLEVKRFGHPDPFVQIDNRPDLGELGVQTPTKFQTLLYYPYQWVFKEKIKLKKSSILSIVKENTLYGNLAHRLFEQLLSLDFYAWNKEQVENWIDEKIPILIAKEGAVLNMYGREPDKVNFAYILKFSAWNLISMIQKNGWKVLKTEMELEETINGQEYKGIADIILEKEGKVAILDLKWRGIGWRRDLIKNEEDIQLVLYARLQKGENDFPQTGFFIIENGQLLIRQNTDFEGVTPLTPDVNHKEANQRIFEKMDNTFQWRKTQLEKGTIEIRCEFTSGTLEDGYSEAEVDLFNMLEMKTANAPFDDYRVLIDLVE